MINIKNLKIRNKRVLIRVDYNIPIIKSKIINDFRLKSSFETINYCLSQNCSIVLMSHLGRPKQKDDKYSLEPIIEYLEDNFNTYVHFSEDCISEKSIKTSKEMLPKEIHLLENLRFYNEEILNDQFFAAQLAKHGSIYINDAFGTAHREHASNANVTKHFATKGMGFLVEKEVKFLSENLSNPTKPLTLIIGGAKIDTKIAVIENFLGLADNIIIGGAMANTFMASMGREVGLSLMEKDKIDTASMLINKANRKKTKIILPVDFTGELGKFGSGDICSADARNIPSEMICEDIGVKSIDLFSKIISESETVLWNGTVGVAENPNFATGTNRIVDAIMENELTSIVGGGDTVAAIRNYNEEHINDFTHVSTGGGSCLEMLSGNKLPALEMLKK